MLSALSARDRIRRSQQATVASTPDQLAQWMEYILGTSHTMFGEYVPQTLDTRDLQELHELGIIADVRA